MRTSGKSEDELKKAARPKKKPTGWFDGDIEEVTEDSSQKGDPMFKCLGSFTDTAGEKWTLRVNLVDKGKGALLLRRLCAARGVAAKYDAGSVDQSDLPGPVRLKIGLRKQRNWPGRLEVEDFAAVESSVVPIRSVG